MQVWWCSGDTLTIMIVSALLFDPVLCPLSPALALDLAGAMVGLGLELPLLGNPPDPTLVTYCINTYK